MYIILHEFYLSKAGSSEKKSHVVTFAVESQEQNLQETTYALLLPIGSPHFARFLHFGP